ncbi:hypothetical protein [Parapedobacter tibetensis]|uniref:hypothetical protein n=1 Tax=Parapedobacter tibetensis TaxID=2972951 RepID=UPI00214D5012|nr:hypothetical protein [Parapedobacter tibetensis]
MDKYHNTRNRIEEAARLLDPFENFDRFQQFSVFSANIANFLPMLNYEHHLALFRRAYANQQLSLLDERYFDREVPVAVHGWDAQVISRLRAQPGIICTFHAGSYRLISYLLARQRIPFALLMAHRAHAKQGADFQRRFDDLRKRHGLSDALPIIDAEQPTAVWKITRLLKQGYHLLVYVDGYTGLPVAGNGKLQNIPFLGQHLYVRKGAAFLAHKLRVPLHPVFCMRLENGDIRVMADPSLGFPEAPPQLAVEWAITHIFCRFSNHLLHSPGQWENWFFLHHQVDHGQLLGNGLGAQAPVNDTQLPTPASHGLLSHNGKYFLLEKKGYKTFSIAKPVFEMLWGTWKR